jgi:hypothetical protein
MVVSRFLSKQVNGARTLGTAPHPRCSSFGMGGLAIMPGIFVHGRPALSQATRQAARGWVVGGNAMAYGLSLRKQDISSNVVNHLFTLQSKSKNMMIG